jgi:protein translocase SecG subunit
MYYKIVLAKIINPAIIHLMNTLTNILPWLQAVLAVLLVAGVLAQQTGAGLGGAFGGGDENTSYHTRRGLEKFLFRFTIVISILFVVSALLPVIL